LEISHHGVTSEAWEANLKARKRTNWRHLVSAETDVTLRAEILSYSRSRGLFAGVSLEGSTLRADKNLYGKEVKASDIVFKNVVPVPDSAKTLLATLQKASPVNESKGTSS
jgi:lipid-binding SYLF domain-containing protein